MRNGERGDSEATGRRGLGTGAARCLEGAGRPDPQPEEGSVGSFGSVGSWPDGVGLLPPKPRTVSCHVVVVRSEPGERGAITLCLQVRGLAMLRALYGLVMNGAVIDLHAQSQKLITS